MAKEIKGIVRRHGEVSTKPLENSPFLSGWLDEAAPGRPLATFRSCIAPSGGGGAYTGSDRAAKTGIPEYTIRELGVQIEDPR